MSKLSYFQSILIIFVCVIYIACQEPSHHSSKPLYRGTSESIPDSDQETSTSNDNDMNPISTPSVSDILTFEWPIIQYQPARLRRLTRLQFQNSIHTILGEDIIVPILSDPDLAINGLFNVGASISTFSARGIENIDRITLDLGQQALEKSMWGQRWIQCEMLANEQINCFKQWLKEFVLQAWRRPIEQIELDRLLDFMRQGKEVLDQTQSIFPYMVSAILQSPYFLFRYEQSIAQNIIEEDLDGSEVRNQYLTPLALITRLSFFLYNTSPNQALVQKAIDGKLNTDLLLKTEVENMLSQPESRVGLLNFFNEYLKLYALDYIRKDPTVFEHYYPNLGRDARQETLKLIEFIVFDLNQDFRSVLESKETFVNHRLSALYKIPAPQEEKEGDGFNWIRFAEQSSRGGLFTQASFLALNSHAIESSATLRGMAIRKLLLCQQMPEPPVDVDTSIPEPSGNARTLRERVSEHLENISCAACHKLMDPLGLALENFDAIGRWRSEDHGVLIDASGELDGQEFDGAIALGKAVAQHQEFGKCLVKKMIRYAIGRLETQAEDGMIDALYQRLRAHDFKIKPWIIDLIMSPIFRMVGASDIEHADHGASL